MDRMGDSMLESNTLVVLREDDRLKVVASHGVVIHGRACGDEIDACLTPLSGAHSDAILSGPIHTDPIRLVGHGVVRIGAVTLQDATIRLDPSGLRIIGSVDWSAEPAAARFELDADSGTWHGHVDGRDTLHCSMTDAAVLRVTIAVDVTAGGDAAVSTALAVLDGRNVEVVLGDRGATPRKGWEPGIRLAVLDAVAAFLRTEQRTLADRLAAAIAEPDDEERPTTTSGHPSEMHEPRLPAPARLDALASLTGYVSPSYSQQQDGVPGTRQGYLPAGASAGRTEHHGDLEPSRRGRPVAGTRAVSSTAPPATDAGYLSRVGAMGDGSGAAVRLRASAKASSPTTAAEHHLDAIAAAVELEALGYALLRCKDLSLAVESVGIDQS